MQDEQFLPKGGHFRQPNSGGFGPSFTDKIDWKRKLRSQSGLLGLTVIVNILLLYVVQMVASALMIPFASDYPQFRELLNEVYTFWLYMFAFFFPYLIYAKLVHFDYQKTPHDRPSPPVLASCLGIALGFSVAGAFLSMFVSLFFSMFGLYPIDISINLPSNPAVAVLYVFNMTALPALVEEFVHRGVVLGSLRKYGDGFAIVVSSILFAMLHRNMVQAPNALLLGLLLGYFFVKTNSIITTMVIHFINNLFAVLLSISVQWVGERTASLLQGMLWLVYLVACAGGLIYLLGVRHVQTGLMRSKCPLHTPELHGYFWSTLPAMIMVLLVLWVTFLNFTRL